jgi:hypothetical protein
MRKVIAAPFLGLDDFRVRPQREVKQGFGGEEFDRERLPHLVQLDRIEHHNIHKGYEHE